jgi:hypothetical protein
VQPKRFGDGAPAEHASPHSAANSRQASTALKRHIAINVERAASCCSQLNFANLSDAKLASADLRRRCSARLRGG